MHDSALVRELERLGDLPRDGDGLVGGKAALIDPFVERRPFDQLEHERGRTRCLLDAVDRGDVRVVERREHLRFALEALQAVPVR